MVFHTHSLGWLGEFCSKVSLVVILLITPVYLSAEIEIPVLTSDTQLATAGYYQLSWRPGVAGASNKTLQFELQQSSSSSFHISKIVYQGPDRASVISGKPDGQYYYRVRSLLPDQRMSDWSQPVQVEVMHHSLARAWLFFALGALVFITTLAFILISAAKKEGH